ncbi:S26 family signal peptidase [Sphingobium sp. B11D3A]|uniref:S26 family signal peptidase n=1 Tax=Sphingobium sp. B11D3A TaxID=2940574 RepID=UPI002224ACD7|nr:S26 family signal peptidase [Sphingobium sp. B11D3A]MCW2393567.1 conjugal transfer pilin signal peptidase TrbI [Sphingobium sp. B11D3A]
MPAPIAEFPTSRPLPFWKAGLILIGIVLAWSQAADMAESYRFLVNRTGSLPNWAFVVDSSGRPESGGTIFFVPPANALVIAHFGAGRPIFGKTVLGMPGEVVTHVGPLVYVGGRHVGTMKPVSKRGEPLAPGPTGVIPKGCYYAGSAHPDGFDSRYAAIGFICGGQIVGTGIASVL